ncbi:MAG: flagellar hook-length control protein FliK [Desulfobacteraceae bacterium]|nr:MAG: flagellar hook-length control protein FliK [Desulfobacteraceae bacterium]
MNTNSQGDDKISKHPSKDQPLEGILLKSRPGIQDIEAMIKRMEVLPRDRAGNETAGIDSAIRENTLSVQNSQPQERIPETMSAAKEMEFFQKPLQTTVLKQLVERAAMDLNNGRTAIKINLKPEYLGYLRMEISTENHQVMVKIMTEIPLVKGIIENNISQLKAALGEHGLKMDDLDVFVAHDSDKQGGRDRHTEFTSMESGAGGKRIEGILHGEELITLASENISGKNIIDFFA